VIKSFVDKRTAAIFAGYMVRDLPLQIQKRARAKLIAIDAAKRLDDLRYPSWQPAADAALLPRRAAQHPHQRSMMRPHIPVLLSTGQLGAPIGTHCNRLGVSTLELCTVE